MECSALKMIEAIVNLIVQFEERVIGDKLLPCQSYEGYHK